MKVPFHKQEFWFSCFAACVRMILEYYGIKKTEKEIRKLLKVATAGVWYFVEMGLESLGLHFYWADRFSFDELKGLIRNGTPVIVSLKFPDHPNHTVIVTDTGNEFVTVNDPERGENIRIDIKQFLEAWSNRKYRAGYIQER